MKNEILLKTLNLLFMWKKNIMENVGNKYFLLSSQYFQKTFPAGYRKSTLCGTGKWIVLQKYLTDTNFLDRILRMIN